MRILIVCNDSDSSDAIESMVIRSGYSTHSVPFDTSIIELVNGWNFNMVLVDISFWDNEKLALLNDIRRFNPDVPIIVITEKNHTDLIAKSIDVGANDFIDRSYSSETLRLVIEKYLKPVSK